jgi:hypothetical protein
VGEIAHRQYPTRFLQSEEPPHQQLELGPGILLDSHAGDRAAGGGAIVRCPLPPVGEEVPEPPQVGRVIEDENYPVVSISA